MKWRLSKIRDWLLRVGEGSPYDYYKYEGGTLMYTTVTKYFYLLRNMGLIEVVREEESSTGSPIKKKIYRIVPGKENDEAWF